MIPFADVPMYATFLDPSTNLIYVKVTEHSAKVDLLSIDEVEDPFIPLDMVEPIDE